MKPFVIVALAAFWFVLTIILARLIVPWLVNQHNDGALILAWMLVIGWIPAVFFSYLKTMEIMK